MKLIPREKIQNRCRKLANEYPCVSISGPRQCGKTTFAKTTFPEYEYLDLELPSDFTKIESDPELFLRSRTKPLVIDEAQRMPELFPVLRALIDTDRKKNGRFILLGSASFQLQRNINESLSGRVAFLDFHPFNLLETVEDFSFEAFWTKGGFPDALMNGADDELNFEWFEFYTRTLIERDLPTLGIEFDPRQFRLLWKMASHFHGDILNKNKIASSLGISPHTVDRYLNILEQTFTIKLLPPYFANIKKRLVKSPKLYIRDSGMYHYFSGVRNYESLISSPSLGCSFEGLMVEQIIQGCGVDWTPYYFRTSDGIETDLLLSRGNVLVPIEIKSKLSATQTDIKALEKTLDILGQPKGFFLNLSNDSYPMTKRIVCVGVKKWISEGCPEFWS